MNYTRTRIPLSSNWNIAAPINYTTSGKDENRENLRQMKQVVARKMPWNFSEHVYILMK